MHVSLKRRGDRGIHLPELLGRILASNALEDLRAARVLVDKFGHVVHVVIDDDVHALVGAVVGGDIGGGEGLRHDGWWCEGGRCS